MYFIALSDEEKLLFRALIRQLDNKIKPGLTKLTWNSDYIEDYIKDCNTHTANVSRERAYSLPKIYLQAIEKSRHFVAARIRRYL